MGSRSIISSRLWILSRSPISLAAFTALINKKVDLVWAAIRSFSVMIPEMSPDFPVTARWRLSLWIMVKKASNTWESAEIETRGDDTIWDTARLLGWPFATTRCLRSASVTIPIISLSMDLIRMAEAFCRLIFFAASRTGVSAVHVKILGLKMAETGWLKKGRFSSLSRRLLAIISAKCRWVMHRPSSSAK